MIKSKATAPLIERAWDFVKGGFYGIKKINASSLQDKLIYHESEQKRYETKQANIKAKICKHRRHIRPSELQKQLKKDENLALELLKDANREILQ